MTALDDPWRTDVPAPDPADPAAGFLRCAPLPRRPLTLGPQTESELEDARLYGGEDDDARALHAYEKYLGF